MINHIVAELSGQMAFSKGHPNRRGKALPQRPGGGLDARRVAGRILGQGDIVALVEKASQDLDQSKAEAMAKKLAKGKFDLDDLAAQLQQMKKMGGLQGIMGMLPGVAKMKAQMADTGVDDRMIARQEAILSSMTKTERKKPDLLNASRKKRIAAGAGVEVQDINRLLKQHRQMADMVKSLARGGPKKMQQMAAMLGGLGGGPGQPDMARLKAMTRVHLTATARFRGTVETPLLVIEEGAEMMYSTEEIPVKVIPFGSGNAAGPVVIRCGTARAREGMKVIEGRHSLLLP